MVSVKATALSLARSGRSVISVGKDKRPLGYWQDFQTKIANRHMIATWFDSNPDAQLAMVTGKISNVVVIDCDDEEANQNFLAEFPEAKNTTTVKTPRGYHYWFEHPGGEIRNDASKKIGPHVDVRGDGGYVLVPPSVNLSGVSYHYLHKAAPLPLPEALTTKLRGAVPGDDPRPGPRGGGGGNGDAGKFIYRTGERNDGMTREAGSLRGRGMDEETMLDCLRVINQKQCDPPLPDDELVTIAASIAKKNPEPWAGSVRPPAAPPGTPVVTVMSDVKEVPVEWLWPGYIPLQNITLLEGDSGVCKSWLTMEIAAAVTRGRPLDSSGNRLVQGNVVIMAAEDVIESTIVHRLAAQGADLSKVIAVKAIIDANGIERGLTLEMVSTFKEIIEQYRPKLFVIDPIISYLGNVEMNHNAEVRRMLAPLKQLAEEFNLAVIAVRHIGKSTEHRAQHRGQGAADFVAVARSQFHLIPDSDRRNIRWLAHTKANLGPMKKSLEIEIDGERIKFTGIESYDTGDDLYRKLQDAKDRKKNKSGEPSDCHYDGF